MDVLGNIGTSVMKTLEGGVNAAAFFHKVICSLILDHKVGKRAVSGVLLMQIYFTGVQAMPIVGILALLIGVSVYFEAMAILRYIGASGFLEPILSLLIIREMGPIITAIVVLSRSGTAMASELASMSVNSEIAALRVMRISPFRFIIMPRLLGVTLSAMCLSVYFGAIAVMGGYVVALFFSGAAPADILQSFVKVLHPADILLCLLKSGIFGIIISLTSCYYGLSASESPTQIPQLTTKATVRGLFWCFVAASVVTVLTY